MELQIQIKMKILIRKYIVIVAGTLSIVACEKVIDINLNKSNPRYVIEGNVSNITGESLVKIIKTINFDEMAPYPAVSGALVIITDNNASHSDTLDETRPGIYTKTNLAGTEGHSYTLTVKIGNQTYTASSSMPVNVPFEGLIQDGSAQTGGSGPGSGGSHSKGEFGVTFIQVIPQYTDPDQTDNYYLFVVTRNDTLLNDIFIRNDIGFNGSSNTLPLRVKASKNDVVKVDMQSIDKVVYDYFFGLNENINQSSATPANPTSNINNGALGYFKAHTSLKKTIKIE